MLRLFKILFVIIVPTVLCGQTTWQWSEMAPMPFKTSNNAVCESFVGGEEFVYSFGGIDTTKTYSGIHQRSFKYSVATNTWEEINTLPDTLGKIASAASFVKGKIYIIGGYHVAQNGAETSSDKVHVYNPSTGNYESDANSVPLPIDDHVQCVYKDSLIFVVAGWSNSSNVPNVQIFNPVLNSWQIGSSLTNNAFYTAFGASGCIIGDTLYYHGGASGGSFGARKYMRKGYIDPNDPSNITWSLMDDAPGEAGYRSACSSFGEIAFWLGGSSVSYNYNGIAYDGSGGVNPSARILHFNNMTYNHLDDFPQQYGIMDLRGIAKLYNDKWIICGGMDTNQMVSNRTFLLQNNAVSIEDLSYSSLIIKQVEEKVVIHSKTTEGAMLSDMMGNVVLTFRRSKDFEILRSRMAPGLYYFRQGNNMIRICI